MLNNGTLHFPFDTYYFSYALCKSLVKMNIEQRTIGYVCRQNQEAKLKIDPTKLAYGGRAV